MRRRLWLALGVVALLAVLPATVSATPAPNMLDVESILVTCTSQPCGGKTGPGTRTYAEGDAYNYTGASYGTPQELYGKCRTNWTDSSGVRHKDLASWDATSGIVGYVSLNNSGSETNTQANVTINASAFGSSALGPRMLNIQGRGIFDNSTDTTLPNTGFKVTIQGPIRHLTYNGSYWVLNSTSYGTVTCSTVPPFSIAAPYVQRIYGEGELEPLPA